jgi:hypothetical protein
MSNEREAELRRYEMALKEARELNRKLHRRTALHLTWSRLSASRLRNV